MVLRYDRTSNFECVNQAQKQLFTQKGRSIEGIPPSKAALIQHTKRATYQAGYCWGQVMIAAPELPSPSDWGWTRKEPNGWEVCWTTLPTLWLQERLQTSMQMSKGSTPVHCTLSFWWTLLRELVKKHRSLWHILSLKFN